MTSNFKYHFLHLAAFVFLPVFISCSPKMIPIDNSTSIVVDGDDSDWNNEYLNITKDLNVVYAFNQDQESFRVLIKILDRKTLIKAMIQGVTLWIDESGKSKKQKGIKYPLGFQNTDAVQELIQTGVARQGNSAPDQSEAEQKILELLNNKDVEIGLIGILEKTSTMRTIYIDELTIPIEIKQKAINTDDFTIEYSIPKSILTHTNKEHLSIGIQIDGIDVQEIIRQQMASRGGQFPGLSGGRAGGMGAARARMNEKKQELESLQDPISIWSKVELN